jgi:hypothetical protein
MLLSLFPAISSSGEGEGGDDGGGVTGKDMANVGDRIGYW